MSIFMSLSTRLSFYELIFLLSLLPSQINAEQTKHTAIDAAGLFAEKCLLCHGRPGPWPDAAGLSKLSAEEVYRVLTAGLMRELANDLNDAQKQAIANYLGGLKPDKPSLASGAFAKHLAQKKTTTLHPGRAGLLITAMIAMSVISVLVNHRCQD